MTNFWHRLIYIGCLQHFLLNALGGLGGLCSASSWQKDEEVGRQHQGMDRSGVRQVPESSGEQGNMEETGCEIICGAPTLVVKG